MLFSKNSPRRYYLCSCSPLVLIGWQRKNGYNLYQAQIRHRRNIRNYSIGSVIVFLVLAGLCYVMPIQWGVHVPFASQKWWLLSLAASAALAACFVYMSVYDTFERKELVRYIKKHRRFRKLLDDWGYEFPMSVDGFIAGHMNKLLRDQDPGLYSECAELFAEFGLYAPDFTLPTVTEEEIDAVNERRVFPAGTHGVVVM